MVRQFLAISLISMAFLTSCATWNAKTPAQKHEAAVAYYRIFSAGLQDATFFMDPEKRATAQAVIAMADKRVDALELLAKAQASDAAIALEKAKVQVAIDDANAAVAAAKAQPPIKPGASNNFFYNSWEMMG